MWVKLGRRFDKKRGACCTTQQLEDTSSTHTITTTTTQPVPVTCTPTVSLARAVVVRVLLVHGQGFGEGVARHTFGVLLLVRRVNVYACCASADAASAKQRVERSRKQACGGERRRKQDCGIFDWFRARFQPPVPAGAPLKNV